MARPRKFSGRKCNFESLEGRQMMAGDVLANIVRGQLNITGDNLGNGITITPGLMPNQVVVTGVIADNAATTINGNNVPVTLSNFTGHLNLHMHQANDNVTINGVTVKGNAKVQGGVGNDTILITGSTFNGSLKVLSGKGADMVTLATSIVRGAGKVKTDGSNDMVGITGSTIQKLNVKLAKGNDTLNIANTTAGKTILKGGSGTNTLTLGVNNFLFNVKQRGFLPS